MLLSVNKIFDNINNKFAGLELSRSFASYNVPVDSAESATSFIIPVVYYCQDGRNAAKGTDARERPRRDSSRPIKKDTTNNFRLTD